MNEKNRSFCSIANNNNNSEHLFIGKQSQLPSLSQQQQQQQQQQHCCYCAVHRQQFLNPYSGGGFYRSTSRITLNNNDDTNNTDNKRCTCCDEFDLDFAAGTTCHGLNLVCNTSWSWYRRGCWLILVFFSLSLLATQLHDRWKTFLSFELKTEVAIESARNLTLPSVTLCNANFFSRHAMTPFDVDLFENITYTIAGDIEHDITDLYKAGAKLPDNWTITYWQAAMEYENLERQILQRYVNNSVTRPPFTLDNWLRRTGWQLRNTSKLPSPIIQCRVGRFACSVEDFKPILTPQGLCYTLTNSPTRFVQKAPGGLAGINIFLNINQDDYTKYNLEGLTTQFECGVKVILHEWYEQPDVGQSVGVPPGMSGFVSIKRHKRIISAEKPWSDCVESRDAQNPYSEKQCLSECSAKQTLVDCGCRLWYEPGNATLCGVARTTACLLFKELVSEDTSEEELRCKAKCLEACYVTSYSSSVSYTSLASSGTLRELTSDLIAATGDQRLNEDYVRTNVIALQIAFAQLVTDRTSSTPALTLSAFLSDIGGQLGLFAGISLITICELIEYPLAKLVTVITGNNYLGETLRAKRRRWYNNRHLQNSSNNKAADEQTAAESLQLHQNNNNNNQTTSSTVAAETIDLHRHLHHHHQQLFDEIDNKASV